MKVKRIIAAASIFVVSMLATSGAAVAPQEAQDRLAEVKGDGTLKLGQEEFKITAISVSLLGDQRAEIRLVSDIIVFVSGTWSQARESPEVFDLQITGGASSGGLDCAGKLTLAKDTKNVQLILKGKSRTSKRPIDVYFVGK